MSTEMILVIHGSEHFISLTTCSATVSEVFMILWRVFFPVGHTALLIGTDIGVSSGTSMLHQ